ncbi:MAG: response regulator [Candidatus Competibacteraceae bacterium]|nr:response regulator [Candidatus Competibacteraceae bacterium]
MPVLRRPFTLRQVLGGVYFTGIALLTVGVVMVLGSHLSAHFREALVAQGRAIAEQLARDSRLALIQRAVENVEPRLETAVGYPNVAGIALLNASGEALLALGARPVIPDQTVLEAAQEDTRLVEDQSHWVMIAAVRLEPEPVLSNPLMLSTEELANAPTVLGFVTLTLSQVALQADIRATYQLVLSVMLGGALLVGVLVLGVLSRIIHPLQQLAQRMSDPDTVAYFRPAKVCGVREAQRIATAFNTLIAAFAQVKRTLVDTNLALERSRDNLTGRVQKATGDLMAALEQVERQNIELMEAREQALTASRVKSEFLAHMSHEIRTPMHGVLGFITVLARTPLNPVQASYLHLLQHAADSLMTIIDSILDFSKLEAGKIQLRVAPFPLRHLLETTVQLFMPNAQVKGLMLEWAVDPQLPEQVLGDRQRLAQVLRNLVDNAIKFTDGGRVQVQARLVRREGAFMTCHVEVRDTGIGIPSVHQATIFTAFNQVDASTTRQQGGTGLGLAICQQLVSLMGGCLTVDSQEGQGSSFQFEVRLQIASTDDFMGAEHPGLPSINDEDEQYSRSVQLRAAKPLPPSGMPPARRSTRSTRVLVVDDNPTNRALADIVLADLHTDRDLVSDGEAALTACRQQRYDLILMDLRMPGMDGLETTRRIRQLGNNPNCTVPIIGLTADILGVNYEEWRAAGLTDCLYKPLKVEVLSQVLARWGIGGSSPDPYSIPRFL